MDWYTKKQATVETATYGAEFVAARVAKEQIAALRLDLRYLGVPVKGAARLFGDNESVVKSGSIPHSKLNKRHQALSYHSVREAIASGMLSFSHIPGSLNPSDILSKHWGYQQVWPTLKPILFWKGNTADLLDQEDNSGKKKGSNTDSDFSSPNPDQVQSTNDVTEQRVLGIQDENLPDGSTAEYLKDPAANDKDLIPNTTECTEESVETVGIGGSVEHG
jgi:hypothetical protein